MSAVAPRTAGNRANSYAIAFVEIWRRACRHEQTGLQTVTAPVRSPDHVRHLAFVHYVDRLAIDCGGASSSALATRAAISGPTALIGGGSSIGSSLPTLRAPRVHLARSPRVHLARSPSAQRRGMANNGSVTVNNGHNGAPQALLEEERCEEERCEEERCRLTQGHLAPSEPTEIIVSQHSALAWALHRRAEACIFHSHRRVCTRGTRGPACLPRPPPAVRPYSYTPWTRGRSTTCSTG